VLTVTGDSPLLASGNAADAAGDIVEVQVFGITKVRVDAAATNIAVGDGLVTDDTAGRARKADYTTGTGTAAPTGDQADAAIKQLAAIFAKALEAATADNVLIECFIGQRGDTA